MAKTYLPTMVDDIHKSTVFLSEHNAIIRAAISALDPSALPAYDAALAALLALDALRATLNPIQP
jgi:hypothetical protein